VSAKLLKSLTVGGLVSGVDGGLSVEEEREEMGRWEEI